jgi:DNA-binding CsgD family transcriptional regulator
VADLDRTIQSLYAEAIEGDLEDFRGRALAEICRWLGASSAAWLTRSAHAPPGEYTEFPDNPLGSMAALQKLKFSTDRREIEYEVMPPALARPGLGESGLVLSYAHRGGRLLSVVLLRFPSDHARQPTAEVQRAIGHMVEAASLALRAYIQRDEWLRALGRNSRGSAALVDAGGAIYAASPAFRELLQEDYGHDQISALASPLPADSQEGEGNFMQGRLHFRSSRLHARKPLPLDELSPREQEIARALGKGKTFKTVARQCGIAVSTVANHASRIYKKLGIFRREELVEMVRTPTGP